MATYSNFIVNGQEPTIANLRKKEICLQGTVKRGKMLRSQLKSIERHDAEYLSARLFFVLGSDQCPFPLYLLMHKRTKIWSLGYSITLC